MFDNENEEFDELESGPSNDILFKRMMARALGIIFKENEGIVISLDNKKYALYSQGGKILVEEFDSSESEGTMLWMHGGEIEKEKYFM